MALAAGSKAPAFTAVDQDGNKHSLKDYKGKKLVIYFYPKDNTQTCTVEACNIRDNYDLLTENGFTILGVSPDSQTSHKKFEQKFQLPFPLLVDTDLALAKGFDVWQWKKFMGKEYFGIVRTTFLINEKGKIEHVIDNVVSKDHSKQILDIWQGLEYKAPKK